MTSFVLDVFSVKLFSVAHAAMWSSSTVRVWTLLAGTICVVCELNELVVGVERIEVGGYNSVRRWPETRTLHNTG